MIKAGRTVKLAAGPEINGAEDSHKVTDVARLEYDPAGGTVYINAGSVHVQTKYGSELHLRGTITNECARALLELLSAWDDGSYE